MPSTFSGVETGLRALRTAQVAVDTASHNIANVNTKGYSRQRVEIAATSPYTTPSLGYPTNAMQIGTGAEARTITQARDSYLEEQLRVGLSRKESFVAAHGALSQVEDAVLEPGDNGLSAALTKFFNAFHDLSSHAENDPQRRSVLTKAADVAATFQQTAKRVDKVTDGVNDQITGTVTEINQIAKQIADLNRGIMQVVGRGDQPNDLRDQREMLLQTLSQKANTTVIAQPDGSVNVLVAGVNLVQQTDAIPLSDISDLTATGELSSGSLRGLLDAQTRIASFRADLDSLATTFRDQVNTLHTSGLDKNGVAGLDFFVGGSALDLAVNPDVAADPTKVAAAATPLPGGSFAIGNGDTARQIAELATTKLSAGPLANSTLREYWGNSAAGIGQDVQALQHSIQTHEAFTQQLEARRDAVSGVSLDEEMADMLRFQRAYQAAAKLISMHDELTGNLIAAFGGRA